MDRRTDSGPTLPGTGSHSPLPPVAADRPSEQLLHELLQTVATLTQQVAEMRQELTELRQEQEVLKQSQQQPEPDNYFPQNQLSPYVSTTTAHPQPTSAPPAAKAGEGAEPLLVELPDAFVFSLRHDTPRANRLVRVLRERVLPEANSRERNTFRWCHVWKVLMDHQLIIENVSMKQFGRAIALVVGNGLKGENIRKAATDYDFPRGDYRSWPDNNADKNLCIKVVSLLVEAGVLTD